MCILIPRSITPISIANATIKINLQLGQVLFVFMKH